MNFGLGSLATKALSDFHFNQSKIESVFELNGPVKVNAISEARDSEKWKLKLRQVRTSKDSLIEVRH
jgi:hypothetical protein